MYYLFTYMYLQDMKYPFDVIYLLNSCEFIINTFFLPSLDQLNSGVVSGYLRVHFLNIDGKYEKLDAFTLMQTFNFSYLSNNELDKLVPYLPEIRQVSLVCIKPSLQEIDENYQFSVLEWFIIIIFILGT